MKTLSCYSQILRRSCTLALTLACAAGLTPQPALRADALPQSGYPASTPPAPAPTLAVSVNLGRYSVDANHADVRSVLKLLFDRADRQLVFSNSVTGDVTLRLKDQKFETTLNAVCEDTFLRWALDPKTNIYRFERDQEAVKNSIARLNALSTLLAAKLSALGLNVPQQILDESVSGTSSLGSQVPGNGAGGFGGVTGAPSRFSRDTDVVRGLPSGGAQENDPNGLRARRMEKTAPGSRQPAGTARNLGGGGRGGSTTEETGAQARADAAGAGTPAAPAGVLMQRSAAFPANGPQNNTFYNTQRANVYRTQNGGAYGQFLSQNGLVSLNTSGQKIPVADALQQLGQQANVLILLDPSVPSDEKFTIRAAIPPRSFPEVMNLLASYAQLNWRYLGNQANRVLVTPTPEFQLFWGESEIPRAATPNAEKRVAPVGDGNKPKNP